MNYEKLTVAKFEENLKAGKYKGLTGARRAIGKADGWSEKDRAKARGVADKHFSSGGASAPAKKAKGAHGSKPAKKVASKKVATKKTAAAPKASSKRTAAKKTAGKSKSSPVSIAPVSGVAPIHIHIPSQDISNEHVLALLQGSVVSARAAGIQLSDKEQAVYEHVLDRLVVAPVPAATLKNDLEKQPKVTKREPKTSPKTDESTPAPVAASPEVATPAVPQQVVQPSAVTPPPAPVPTKPIAVPLNGVPVIPGAAPIIPNAAPIPTLGGAITGPQQVVLPKGLDPEGAASLPPEQRAEYEKAAAVGEAVRQAALPPQP